MTQAVVAASGVNLHLKSGGEPLHILKDVDLTLDAGEVAAVVGPSGSGKTSLLMVLGGLERPSGGRIEIAGTRIEGLNEDRLAAFRRRALGIVFQNFHLIPSLSALENVALTLEIADPARSFGSIRDQAAAALDEVGLSARLGHLPSALSGGEQQRVGLARAMVGNPRLLLADEPTGNLDRESAAQVMELLTEINREEQVSFLISTHDEKVAAACRRQIRMVDGVTV